jgi:putative transposase
MNGIRSMRIPQKFASIQSSMQNHFNVERHFFRRKRFREDRFGAMAEWRQLAA